LLNGWLETISIAAFSATKARKTFSAENSGNKSENKNVLLYFLF